MIQKRATIAISDVTNTMLPTIVERESVMRRGRMVVTDGDGIEGLANARCSGTWWELALWWKRGIVAISASYHDAYHADGMVMRKRRRGG